MTDETNETSKAQDALTLITVDDSFGSAPDTPTDEQLDSAFSNSSLFASVDPSDSATVTRADKVYSAFSGFIIGVCIALALFTVIYIGYQILNLGSEHGDTEPTA